MSWTLDLVELEGHRGTGCFARALMGSSAWGLIPSEVFQCCGLWVSWRRTETEDGFLRVVNGSLERRVLGRLRAFPFRSLTFSCVFLPYFTLL